MARVAGLCMMWMRCAARSSRPHPALLPRSSHSSLAHLAARLLVQALGLGDGSQEGWSGWVHSPEQSPRSSNLSSPSLPRFVAGSSPVGSSPLLPVFAPAAARLRLSQRGCEGGEPAFASAVDLWMLSGPMLSQAQTTLPPRQHLSPAAPAPAPSTAVAAAGPSACSPRSDSVPPPPADAI